MVNIQVVLVLIVVQVMNHLIKAHKLVIVPQLTTKETHYAKNVKAVQRLMQTKQVVFVVLTKNMILLVINVFV